MDHRAGTNLLKPTGTFPFSNLFDHWHYLEVGETPLSLDNQ